MSTTPRTAPEANTPVRCVKCGAFLYADDPMCVDTYAECSDDSCGWSGDLSDVLTDDELAQVYGDELADMLN